MRGPVVPQRFSLLIHDFQVASNIFRNLISAKKIPVFLYI
jgi:hypothetical protein